MPKIDRPLAVLFDFDGVLADTANLHIVAWERVFARMGLELPPDTCWPAAEVDDRVFLRGVLESKGIEPGRIDEAGWLLRKREETLGMLGEEPRLYPGVAELVERVSALARLSIVSTAWREAIEAVLGSAVLGPRFEVIVAKEDVEHTKPDAEPYRRALEKMKLKGRQAVALEDSPTGMCSAAAAGVRVIAVGHRMERGEWTASAAGYVEGFTDTDQVLRELGFDRPQG